MTSLDYSWSTEDIAAAQADLDSCEFGSKEWLACRDYLEFIVEQVELSESVR